MNHGRHRHSAAQPPGRLGGFVSSARAKFGQGGAHSWRPKHVRTEDGRLRRFRSPIILFVCAFVLASGGVAVAYTTTSVSGTGRAQAMTLSDSRCRLCFEAGGDEPVLELGGSSGAAGARWVPRPAQHVAHGAVRKGLQRNVSTVDDAGVDGDLLHGHGPDTRYDLLLRGRGGLLRHQHAVGERAHGPVLRHDQAAGITSADTTTFAAGSPGTFTVTTAGLSTPLLTDSEFTGCTPSTLPGSVTFTDDHNGTATLAGTPAAASAGSYTVCIKASDGTGLATQTFTLTVASQASAPGSAPAVTSASSTSFFVGAASSFQVAASGGAAPTFSNAAFSGCAPSSLPSGITFSGSGLLSGTPGADAVGTYTVCVNAANGNGENGTQELHPDDRHRNAGDHLSCGVGGHIGTPNLGPITVQRQTGSGTPITTGGALTVNLTSSPSGGATFGATPIRIRARDERDHPERTEQRDLLVRVDDDRRTHDHGVRPGLRVRHPAGDDHDEPRQDWACSSPPGPPAVP